MDYINKLELQTEEVKEVETLEKHTITNNVPFSVNKYNGHTIDFLALDEDYNDGFNQLKETNGLSINCIVSKRVNEIIDKLRDNNIVYAVDFGVKADGKTDNTTALQNAINSLAPKQLDVLDDYQNSGGTVILPKGKIVISGTIRLYSNVKIMGTNKRLFGRISQDTTILYNNTNVKSPCFSFVGIDTTTKIHSNNFIITGEEMDAGSVSQTWNVTLKDFTIVNKGDSHLAINLSGAVKSTIDNIAFEYFDVDIVHSAGWDNKISNCNTLCRFAHIIATAGNTLLVENAYVNQTEDKLDALPVGHKLYNYVNNENLHGKNRPTGIINIGNWGMNIEKAIIEKIEYGIQFCLPIHSPEKFFNNCSFNKIHMEHVSKPFAFANVVALLNGFYGYIPPENATEVINAKNSHITSINVQPIKWIKLYNIDETSVVNVFGSNNEWITGTELSSATIGKMMMSHYNDQAIMKTWQNEIRTIVGDNVVSRQIIDYKEQNTCEVNISKLVISNPPESPIDVRYAHTVIINYDTPRTIYGFRARDLQRFTVLALTDKASFNGPESGGTMVIKGNWVDPMPIGGVIEFICYDGVCYEVSRSF